MAVRLDSRTSDNQREVRLGRFEPARLDSQPVEATTTVAPPLALIRTVVPR